MKMFFLLLLLIPMPVPAIIPMSCCRHPLIPEIMLLLIGLMILPCQCCLFLIFLCSSSRTSPVRCMPLYHIHHKYTLCPHRSLHQLLCRSTPGAYLLVSCASQWLMLSVAWLHLRCDPSRCMALMPSGVPCSLSPLPTWAGRLRSACHSSAMSRLHRSRLAAPLPDQHRAARLGPLRRHRIQCCPQLLHGRASRLGFESQSNIPMALCEMLTYLHLVSLITCRRLCLVYIERPPWMMSMLR
jgi:hypothetical protein